MARSTKTTRCKRCGHWRLTKRHEPCVRSADKPNTEQVRSHKGMFSNQQAGR